MLTLDTLGLPTGSLSYTVSALLVTLLLTSYISSRRFSHIPGPFSPLSSWLLLNSISGQTGPRAAALSKFGSLVRISSSAVATDDPEVVAKVSRWRRAPWYRGFRMDGYDNMISELDTTTHDRLKAKTAYAMAGKDGVDLEGSMDAEVQKVVGILRAGVGKTVDLAPLVRNFTVDVFSHLLFGKPLGFLDEEDLFGLGGFVDRFNAVMSVLADIGWLRTMVQSPLLGFLQPRATDQVGVGKLLGTAKTKVEERLKSASKDDGDILGSFIRNGMTPDETYRNGIMFLVGGGDTTAGSIRGALLYTMTTSRVYLKLKKEIREAVKTGAVSEPVTLAEAKKLPYLNAVLHEGIRLRPAGTIGHPKLVPPEGDTIDGHRVPGGTLVYVNWVGIGLRKDVFGEDVEIFRPERYLEATGSKRAEMERVAEMAFGTGRYQCPGKNIAMTEMRKLLFELLRNFDFQVVKPGNPWRERSWSNWLQHDMFVRVTKAEWE